MYRRTGCLNIIVSWYHLGNIFDQFFSSVAYYLKLASYFLIKSYNNNFKENKLFIRKFIEEKIGQSEEKFKVKFKVRVELEVNIKWKLHYVGNRKQHTKYWKIQVPLNTI